MNIVPVILSGGVGTRLWPLSRSQYPKQFLSLVNHQSLFQTTVDRVSDIDGFDPPLIVCNEEHRFIVAEQLRNISCESLGILLEPEGRDTAPAIVLAALYLEQHYQTDFIMLVMPADHIIENHHAFLEAVEVAKEVAESGSLVTLGVTPNKPETGYGYIQLGERLGKGSARKVVEFVEKPNEEKAKIYLESGNYVWNSGVFLFQNYDVLKAMKQYCSSVFECCQRAIKDLVFDLDFIRVGSSVFKQCPKISIDYAVMEKTASLAVVPFNAGWNDVGVWSSLWDVGEKDENANVTKGQVVTLDSHQNLVYAKERTIGLLGVNDLVVIDSPDALLITRKTLSQGVKKLVDVLSKQNEAVVLQAHTVERPWGSYKCIESGEDFLVKYLTVKTTAKLSLQKHQYRAEHWVVINGDAEVHCAGKDFLLHPNQSTYIPTGAVHRLGNPSKDQILEIIEIQSGQYLSEDDIERFDDDYGRQNEG